MGKSTVSMAIFHSCETLGASRLTTFPLSTWEPSSDEREKNSALIRKSQGTTTANHTDPTFCWLLRALSEIPRSFTCQSLSLRSFPLPAFVKESANWQSVGTQMSRAFRPGICPSARVSHICLTKTKLTMEPLSETC